jgi:transcriptional regulator with XRE-family HTH domain
MSKLLLPKAFAAALGSQIRTRRKALGMTLQAFHARAGFSLGFLSDLERGKRGASVYTVWLLAVALGCAVADLLPGE